MRQLQRPRKGSICFRPSAWPVALLAASDPLAALDAYYSISMWRGYDSDPGAAVRVHQLLDLRLRLLQRHPVSAALPSPLLSWIAYMRAHPCLLLFIEYQRCILVVVVDRFSVLRKFTGLLSSVTAIKKH